MTFEGICWAAVLALFALPAGIALLVIARQRVLPSYTPFDRMRRGAVLLAGVMRAERGVAYLEDEAGRRVRMEAGLLQLPAPGTPVVLYGEALDVEADARLAAYRDMRALWRVRPDEICRAGETPLLVPPAPPPPYTAALQASAVLLITVGVFFGAGWPTFFNWCHCVWPKW